MLRIKNKHFIDQIGSFRKNFTQIREKYDLNRGELELLCACYSMQTNRQPYFQVPDLIKHIEVLQSNRVYRYINQLQEKGCLKITGRTSNRITANYYSVTHKGEKVLKKLDCLMGDIAVGSKSPLYW